MSRQNVEIMRRHYEAVNRNDLTAMLERIDPDAEWWDRADDPDATVHRGRDAITKHWADVEDLADLRIEPKEFIDAGDCVVVPVRLMGRGRASDAPFHEQEVHVSRLRDGKITEFREYREMSEALKAVGLEE
jgi:ketosteroid isomerase-like protein